MQPFFTTKQRGTGLGLAIVERRLAELGSHLDIESPLGADGGTRVRADVLVSQAASLKPEMAAT
jgi:signal transduction histidine kinase